MCTIYININSFQGVESWCVAQRRREAEYERTGDRVTFLESSHEKLKFLMVLDKDFNHERERDEDGHDQASWRRGGSVKCKGCKGPEIHPAKLPCGHTVCLACVERTETPDEHEIWYTCVLCNTKCADFDMV